MLGEASLGPRRAVWLEAMPTGAMEEEEASGSHEPSESSLAEAKQEAYLSQSSPVALAVGKQLFSC